MAVASVIRRHRPRFVLTSDGSGVHPDHKAVTDIVTHAVFYARLPKWDVVLGGEILADSDPHEIDRLFYGHCRMERPWREFDFAVDVTDAYQRKTAAVDVYRGPSSAGLRPRVWNGSASRTSTSGASSASSTPKRSRHAVRSWSRIRPHS